MIKTRAIAAYHEAGHAVIAHKLGADVCRVSIEDDSGRTQIKRLGRGVGRIERIILINLAGPYAQRRYAPRSRWRSRSHTGFNSGYDFDNVTDLIYDIHGMGKVAEALLALCRGESQNAGRAALVEHRRACSSPAKARRDCW